MTFMSKVVCVCDLHAQGGQCLKPSCPKVVSVSDLLVHGGLCL